MFRALKYIFVISLYKKTKKQFLILAIAIMIILVSSLMINDIMTTVSGKYIYLLILIKWMIILSMILLVILSLLKILKVLTSNPIIKFSKEKVVSNNIINKKKDIILKKDKLLTESETIINKYKENK
jgi:hypothetical protein